MEPPDRPLPRPEDPALSALADVAVAADLQDAGPAITELETLASRHGMRELVVMATTLRARRGEPGALDTAGLMALSGRARSELDNPLVHERVAAADAGIETTRS